MSVERRDLVDFGERELHLLRQRGEMRGGEISVAVLDQVQMFDQEIAPALAVAQQRAHLRERLRLDLASFRRLARAVAPSQSSAVLGARVHLESFSA
jgi:GAF domain-containing protein